MRITFQIFVALVIVVLGASSCLSQAIDSAAEKALADSALKSFLWDVQKFEKGSMMFLDVPYVLNGQPEYITLSVAKTKRVERPAFISVIFPSTIERVRGFFLTFAKTEMKDGKWSVELARNIMVHLSIDTSDESTYRTRLFQGFAKGGGDSQTADVFQDFLQYDDVLLLFFENGQHKSVMVPLSSFKNQYRKLE